MTTPLDTHDPSVRRFIINEYNKEGAIFVEKKYGVARRNVQNWKKLLASTGSLAARYDHSGRQPDLTAREIKKLENFLIDDPFATNAELAAIVGNKVTPRGAGNYISRSTLGFTKKLESRDVETSFTPETTQLGLAFMKRIQRVPLAKRIYIDETFASSGIARRTGRYPQGKTGWSKQNRKYPRMTIIGAINKDGWLRSSKIYNKGSITTEEFERYVRYNLCPLLNEGDVVIWDRLGRSGRAKNPTSLHFSPKAKKFIENRGAAVIMLPPTGKYLNPIEIIFGDTKRKYEKMLAKKMRQCEPSKMPFDVKAALWRKAETQLPEKSFKRAYHERANGQEFTRVYKERGLIN